MLPRSILCAAVLLVALGGVAAPANAAPPLLGYSNDHSVWLGQQTPDGFAAAIARGGGTIARIEVPWPGLQPSEGPIPESAWRSLDELTNALRRRHVRPLLLVQGSPPWARDLGMALLCEGKRFCLAPPADHRAQAWGAFVAAVAQRYPEAIGIEVLNEPNRRTFRAAGFTAERFVGLVCAARSAVRRAGVQTPIVSAGLAQPGREFLGEAYEAGLGNCADAIGVHPYAADAAPDRPNNLFRSELDGVRAVMRAHGDDVHPVWITEIGWLTLGRGSVTEREQAANLVTAYRLAAAEGIATFIVHTLEDPSGTDSPLGTYGVLGSSGIAKPAYAALHAAVSAAWGTIVRRPARSRRPAAAGALVGRKGTRWTSLHRRAAAARRDR